MPLRKRLAHVCMYVKVQYIQLPTRRCSSGISSITLVIFSKLITSRTAHSATLQRQGHVNPAQIFHTIPPWLIDPGSTVPWLAHAGRFALLGNQIGQSVIRGLGKEDGAIAGARIAAWDDPLKAERMDMGGGAAWVGRTNCARNSSNNWRSRR